jgi:hypothetical protein
MAGTLLRWFREAYRRYRERDVQCGERRGGRRGAAADPQLCVALTRLKAEMSAAAGYVRALAEKYTAAAGGGRGEDRRRRLQPLHRGGGCELLVTGRLVKAHL